MAGKSRLSTFRTELMGLAAAGVLLVHSQNIAPWPGRIKNLVGYGGVGVYMFVFLSGVGLYHSLRSRGNDADLGEFYRRRFSRLLTPYLVIAGIWYGLKYLILSFQPGMFLAEWSTLSFWLHHRGAWYVAAMIPIYLIYPFFFAWMERGCRDIKTMFLISCVFGVMAAQFHWMPELFHHLCQVMNSLWIFILGHYCGKKVYEGSQLPELPVLFAVMFLAAKVLPLYRFPFWESPLYCFKGIVLLYLFAVMLSWVDFRWIHRCFSWLGTHSLELYLTNIFLIQAMKQFGLQPSPNDLRGYAVYAGIVLLGVGLSAAFAAARKRISVLLLRI